MSLAHDVTLHAGAPMAPFESGGKPTRAKRDLKKLSLLVGLSVLAWVSTYTGMLELIQANLGEVGLVERVATGLAVAMLQIMIVWLLDQMFSPIPVAVKGFYIVGYLFLSLISVGFAFGFYWKVLESRSASTSSAESSIGSVQSALRGAETRLDQLVSTLEALTAISTQKAEQEAANGNSCPGSKPGAGPRMAMRRGDAEKFSFASSFVKGRSDQVKGDIKGLDTDLQRILKDDKSIIDAKTGTRNDFLKGMGRKLEDTTTRYNALRTDPQLRQIRQDAAERAEKTTFPDTKGGTYTCPDGQLQSALRGVVAAIDQLPSLEKPKIAATEGSEAVIEAFRRLTMTLAGAITFKLPPTPEELREKQMKAVQAMENPAAAAAAQKALNLEAAGLGKRDYIPLGIAIFVDFCLLMVSFGRPANRFAKTASEIRAAELGPQSAIVGITREVHEDRIIRRNFELLQHVVVHFGSHYLAAVPLAAPRKAPDGRQLSPEERERLQVEAQQLVTLFSGLELNSAVIDRGLPPFVLLLGGARLLRSRLVRQESKFAHAGAFRFYRFRNRAWPEMILGTVMGTAKRYQAELAQRRAEEAQFEAEQRRIEADERRAINAQRQAENARRIAEAELRTMEAQMRQRGIEEQLHEAARLRSQMASQRHAGPTVAAGSLRAGLRPFAPHAVAPQPAVSGPNPAPFATPANHNTAAPEPGRSWPAALTAALTASPTETRPLPPNVVAMPDRFERGPVSELPTSIDLAHAAASRVEAATATTAPALAEPSASQAPTATVETGIETAAHRSDAGTSANLSSLLRTVAVTQVQMAHNVAEAVHRIEGQLPAAREILSEAKFIDGSAEPVAPVTVRPPAPFSGPGLAHDHGPDDAGAIAARYAPTVRPR